MRRSLLQAVAPVAVAIAAGLTVAVLGGRCAVADPGRLDPPVSPTFNSSWDTSP